MLTSTFITAYGTTTLTIDNQGANHTFDVSSIGQLSYDFDQTPDALSIDRIQALYSSISISAPNYNNAGTDLWELLRTASLNNDLTCLLSLNSVEFKFRLRNADLSYNERSQLITMTLIPFILPNILAQSVFDVVDTEEAKFNSGTPSNIVQGGFTDLKQLTLDVTSVEKYIKKALNLVFDNNHTNIYLSAESNLDSPYVEDIYGEIANDHIGFVMVDMSDSVFDTSQPGAEQFTTTGTVTYQFPAVGDEIVDLIGSGTSFLTQVLVNDVLFVDGYQIGSVHAITSNTLLKVDVRQASFEPRNDMLLSNSKLSILRPIAPNVVPAINHLKDLAGMEGAFFGTGFSKNFYVNRVKRGTLLDGTLVTIDYDNVTEFKPASFNLAIGKSFVAQRADFRRLGGPSKYGQWPLKSTGRGSGLPNLQEFENITSGAINATKGIEIGLAPGYPNLCKVERKFFNLSANVNGYGDILENALTKIGLTSYFQALNNTTNGLVVEFTVLGAFSLEPWQSFQFDSRAPEKYRNRQFRITSISYDFINDTATVKGYQIDDITTPIFPNNPINVGINASFGELLLPEGMLKATNASIGDSVSNVQDVLYRTNEFLTGTFTSLKVIANTIIDPEQFQGGIVGFKGYSIKIVNPLTLKTIDATLSKDFEIDDTSISIDSVTTNDLFPSGCYVYISQRQILSGVITGEFNSRIFAQSTSIGTLMSNVSGYVASLSVLLNVRIRKGQDLKVVGARNATYSFTVADNYEAGLRVIDITENDGNLPFIVAKAGAFIFGDPVSTQAEINVSPGEIAFGVDAEYEQISLGLTTAEIPAGSAITTIPLDKLRSNLFSGTQVVLSSWQGSERFVLNGNATASESPVNLSVNTQTPNFDYDAGSEVFEPSFSQSSRITVNANSIVLKVDTNGNIAAISLLGDPDLGSAIVIQADQITLAGQTTFLSALGAEGFPTVSGINVTIQATTAPTVRPSGDALVFGDLWINTTIGNKPYVWTSGSPNAWVQAYTQIDGGFISTGTVDTARLNVSNIITVGEISTETYADTVASTAQANAISTSRSNLSATIRSTTAPTLRGDGGALVAGDTWIKTDSGNLPHTWSGSVWVQDYTIIDGGSISTGAIESANYAYTSGDFSTAGTEIDLTTGRIRAKNFAITGTGDAKFKGTIEATAGEIADLSIGTTQLLFDRDGAEVSIDTGKVNRTLTGQGGLFDTAGFYINADNYFLLITQGDFSSMDAFPAFHTTATAQFANTTDSTSKDSGSVIIEGGVGIEKNLYVGGATINFANLPTSDAGLAVGSLWRDSNTVKVKT